MMILFESFLPPFPISTQGLAFVVVGGLTCWLVSAMSPNNFESIIFVVNRSLAMGLIRGAQAARQWWDDLGDSDALVTGDRYRRRATDSLLRVTIFLCRLGGIPVLPCASGEVYAEMVHKVERLGKRKFFFIFQALESPTRTSSVPGRGGSAKEKCEFAQSEL